MLSYPDIYVTPRLCSVEVGERNNHLYTNVSYPMFLFPWETFKGVMKKRIDKAQKFIMAQIDLRR